MSREILLLVDALAREKNVTRDVVFGALESALASAMKKPRTTPKSASPSIGKPAATKGSAGGWSCPTKRACKSRQAGNAVGRPGNGAWHSGWRIHRRGPRARRVRPHRRPGRQAGDPAEDPRRRARAGPERLPGSWRDHRVRHHQAHGQGRRHRRDRQDRSPPAALGNDPEGKPARGRPRARLCAARGPRRPWPAGHPVAHLAGIHPPVVRERSARDRAGPARNQGRRP